MNNIFDLHKGGKIKTISKNKINYKNINSLYTPGVIKIVNSILDNKDNYYLYTNANNLVAVITNATAVLGLGKLPVEASKPIMEGKCLFYHMFDLNAIDIEIDDDTIDGFVNTVIKIHKTFAAIHLEDIKSPECFYIEKQINKNSNIPVIHDDQHCTAIAIAANVLYLSHKNKIKDIVIFGAGAAGIASCYLLKELGYNIYLFDSKGLITKDRKDINEFKTVFACNSMIAEDDLINNADLIIMLTSPNVLDYKKFLSVKENAIIFSLANPQPDINVNKLINTRKDITIYIGSKSKKFNHINNCLVFPVLMKFLINNKIKYDLNIGIAFSKSFAYFMIKEKCNRIDMFYIKGVQDSFFSEVNKNLPR